MAQSPEDKNKKIQVTLNAGNKIITVLCCVCCGIVALIAIIALIWEEWKLENFMKNFLVLGLMCFICHASIIMYFFTDFFTMLWSILTSPDTKKYIESLGYNLPF